MPDNRIHQARAALARAEHHWKGQASCLSGGVEGVIARAFGNIHLPDHISIGGIMPVGLHEIGCHHDDCASSLLAWYLATLTSDNHASRQDRGKIDSSTPRTVFWIRQRRALDQGGLYSLSLPIGNDASAPLMMSVDQQDTALWTCEEVAKSGQVGAIVIETTDYDLTTARRLQLACEKGGTRIIVLRPAHRGLGASSAWTRWQISPVAQRHIHSIQEQQTPSDQNSHIATSPSTGNLHQLSLIGGRGVRPGSWKVKADAATFSLSVVDPLENRLPHHPSGPASKSRHVQA